MHKTKADTFEGIKDYIYLNCEKCSPQDISPFKSFLAL